MADRLIAALAALSTEEAFGLLYSAYEYLGQSGAEAASFTARVIARLRAGDMDTLLLCLRKLLEEQDELHGVLAGEHAHEGQTPRQTLINEAQQSLYWPALLCVARAVPYDEIDMPAFLQRGLAGKRVGKRAFDEGGKSEVAVLRRALVAVGRALAAWAAAHPEEAVEPTEVAVADLREMAGKDYLRGWLSAQLG
jgi:hypothetical protein